MCFASSIVEAHKRLFIAKTGCGGSPGWSSRGNTGTQLGCAEDRNICQSSRRAYSSSEAQEPSSKTVLVNHSKIPKMSRNKIRVQPDVCADCGASDPSWTSINRGILLCADCCSVHRSLGRHISIVKSLRHGTWEPSVLNFVNSLHAHGANSVWEHHLLDGSTPSGGAKGSIRLKKPSPKDPLHPNKSDFIKAKHLHLAFVLKPNLQDDDGVNSSSLEHELSKQLHASVRTSNLETSLRLLVQGADPNFYHDEKLSTPLHVAAKFGQASQIELLIVYGADINVIDGNGLTPLEVAKTNNHTAISDRLLDAMYEVTDRLIVFLGGKKPDHSTDHHLVISESNIVEINEQLKIARSRLQLVPNKMFEELVMDLYDEVDRRENEAIWSTSTLNADNAAVPFLPTNPYLSATRNQGRQKLARFTRTEFNCLITDVLIDACRRQNMVNIRSIDDNNVNQIQTKQRLANGIINNCKNKNSLNDSFYIGNDIKTSRVENHDPNLSDDEPIYDPVADDDYEPMPQIVQQAVFHQSAKCQSDDSFNEIEILRKQINEYITEINNLKSVVQQLSNENTELKMKFANENRSDPINTIFNTTIPSAQTIHYDEALSIDLANNEEPHSLPIVLNGDNVRDEILSQTVQKNILLNINTDTKANMSQTNANSSAMSNCSNQSTIKRPASMYERRMPTVVMKNQNDCRGTSSMCQMDKNNHKLSELINQKADAITQCLKELIHVMQDVGGRDGLILCAERIRGAVLELINIFASPSNCNEIIQETLIQLNRNNILIQHNCENLRHAYDANDQVAIIKHTKDVRECAYYIASATKTLVLQID